MWLQWLQRLWLFCCKFLAKKSSADMRGKFMRRKEPHNVNNSNFSAIFVLQNVSCCAFWTSWSRCHVHHVLCSFSSSSVWRSRLLSEDFFPGFFSSATNYKHQQHSLSMNNNTRTKVVWQQAEWLTPRLYSPGGSIELTVWLEFVIACFGWGWPQISPSTGESGSLSNTVSHWTPQVYLPIEI